MNKQIFRRFFSFVFCLYLYPGLAVADPEPQPILPLKPAELITYLPPAPPKWIVTRSVANDRFTGWVVTQAERDFKLPPPPPAPGASPTSAPPVTLNVHIIDAGYSSRYNSLVQPPAQGPPPSGTTFLKINNFPASKDVVDSTTTNLNIVIKDRFLVEIKASNVEDDDLMKYATTFDFTKLTDASESGQTSLPYVLVLSQVDELNPQNNISTRRYLALPK